MGSKTMASHLLLLVAFPLFLVHQAAGFSTGQCQEDQLLKILADVKSCSAALRWSSDYCEKHARIENCLERAFQACFSNGVAQKLVRGEKARLRLNGETRSKLTNWRNFSRVVLTLLLPLLLDFCKGSTGLTLSALMAVVTIRQRKR